jgi:hypothetical protein
VPLVLRVAAAGVIALTLALGANWIYQVVRKPSELLFPAGTALNKSPAETWQRYGAGFRRYATATITPDFLAALSQVEAAGNPVARTYWRWSWGVNPLDLYRPASTSVGLYQMTDGTFAEARRYCIRSHLAEEGRSCAPSFLQSRVFPGDAIEVTSAYLDRQVAGVLAELRTSGSLQQRQHLAAAIHLCGAGVGARYAYRGFRFEESQRCGNHDPRAYLARVDVLQKHFRRLAAADGFPETR